MTVTREQLVAAFRAWEEDRRAGLCIDQATVDATPIDQAAEDAADWLLRYLGGERAPGAVA